MSYSQPKRVRPSDPNFEEVVLEWFNAESEGDDDPADSDADAICSEHSSDSEVSSLSSQDEDDQDETFTIINVKVLSESSSIHPNFEEVVLEWFNAESRGDDDPADSDADAICSEHSSDSEVSSLSSQDEDDQDETFTIIT
ncbi:hypothetical protein FQA39_LY12202 [Lamprigera yunnana]|nr:hypothetical protein FQA39_LY12202 [Lamprigera yunnana]